MRSSDALVAARMSLKRCPVRSAQQPGQIETVKQERMDEHPHDCEMYDVGEKHQSDAKHDREHCRLIRIGAALYRKTSRYPHRQLMRETTPPCCQSDSSLAHNAAVVP